MVLNEINIIIFCLFFLPIILGAFTNFSQSRIQYSLDKLSGEIELFASLVLSVYITNRMFFNNQNNLYIKAFKIIPDNIRNYLQGQNLLTYLICVPVLMLPVMLFLKLIFTPLYNCIYFRLAVKLHAAFSRMNPFLRRFAGAVIQIPRSICFVILFCLLLNLTNYYLYIPTLSDTLNSSSAYKKVNAAAIKPLLNSSIVKKVPVLLNDSFKKSKYDTAWNEDGIDIGQLAKKLINGNGNVRVIEYFNGVTLDEAVKSNLQIDMTAKSITKGENGSIKKAYAIYKWISKNIVYDNEKAIKVSSDPKGVQSGSIVAFETRKGICFDYASLFVSMGKAAGLKTRLVTGLAFSGAAWGDHAWNQVYSPEENRWINVDPTFGSSANYFDKQDFDLDHKYAEIQGEW